MQLLEAMLEDPMVAMNAFMSGTLKADNLTLAMQRNSSDNRNIHLREWEYCLRIRLRTRVRALILRCLLLILSAIPVMECDLMSFWSLLFLRLCCILLSTLLFVAIIYHYGLVESVRAGTFLFRLDVYVGWMTKCETQ